MVAQASVVFVVVTAVKAAEQVEAFVEGAAVEFVVRVAGVIVVGSVVATVVVMAVIIVRIAVVLVVGTVVAIVVGTAEAYAVVASVVLHEEIVAMISAVNPAVAA